MIITVTCNPALDKTAELESISISGLNRLKNLALDAGGKGINVSKMIKTLGGKSLATGFIGGGSGDEIIRQINAQGIEHDFVQCTGNTRTNLKVLSKDSGITEFNEPGSIVSEVESQSLINKLLSLANTKTIFVLSGSIPINFPKTYYRDLCKELKLNGAKVYVDADGEVLREAIKAKPDLVKPNLEELASLFVLPALPKLEEARMCCEKLIEEGVGCVALSLGKNGALFVKSGMCIYAEGLTVKSQSTVGAGDSLVAALAYAEELSLPFDETVKLAMAASAAAVTTVGTNTPEPVFVQTLKKDVILHYL